MIVEPVIRTISDSPQILRGLADGTLELWGGVIRHAAGSGNGGRIVAHLKLPSDQQAVEQSLRRLQDMISTHAGTAQAGMDALQSSLSVVQGLQVANLALSGVNLAVTAVGFVVVCRKLDRISGRIEGLYAGLAEVTDALREQRARDMLRDVARFQALRRSAAHFYDLGDAGALRGLLPGLYEQYAFTRLVLLDLAGRAPDGRRIADEPVLLQERLVHLGLLQANLQMKVGLRDAAHESLTELSDQIGALNRERVRVLTSDPARAFFGLDQAQGGTVIEFLRSGSSTRTALGYQADLLAVAARRPEGRALLDAESEDILVLRAA